MLDINVYDGRVYGGVDVADGDAVMRVAVYEVGRGYVHPVGVASFTPDREIDEDTWLWQYDVDAPETLERFGAAGVDAMRLALADGLSQMGG
jgi:hypothetical protein